jgi:hypothetical protein
MVRTIKLIIAGIIILLVLSVSYVIYMIFIRPLTLPVYQLAQQTTEQGVFTSTTLRIGDRLYIHGAAESSLELADTWVWKNAMIGRTNDGMEVYSIPYQDPCDYIMLTTEMYPNEVFRNANLPPIQLDTLKVDEIRLLGELQGKPNHATTDPAILTELIGCLVRHENNVTGSKPANLVQVRLISQQYPGLAYLLYAMITQDERVFLALQLAPDDWIPAGPAFTNWFKPLALP